MNKRVKYNCKKCNWETSVILQWADLRPKMCMNKSCKTSFLKYPEELAVEFPAEEVKEESSKVSKKLKG